MNHKFEKCFNHVLSFIGFLEQLCQWGRLKSLCVPPKPDSLFKDVRVCHPSELQDYHSLINSNRTLIPGPACRLTPSVCQIMTLLSGFSRKCNKIGGAIEEYLTHLMSKWTTADLGVCLCSFITWLRWMHFLLCPDNHMCYVDALLELQSYLFYSLISYITLPGWAGRKTQKSFNNNWNIF